MSYIDWESLSVDYLAGLSVSGWEYLPVDIKPITGTIYSITVVGDHIQTPRYVDVAADFVSNTPTANIVANTISNTETVDITARYITETQTIDIITGSFTIESADVFV